MKSRIYLRLVRFWLPRLNGKARSTTFDSFSLDVKAIGLFYVQPTTSIVATTVLPNATDVSWKKLGNFVFMWQKIRDMFQSIPNPQSRLPLEISRAPQLRLPPGPRNGMMSRGLASRCWLRTRTLILSNRTELGVPSEICQQGTIQNIFG